MSKHHPFSPPVTLALHRLYTKLVFLLKLVFGVVVMRRLRTFENGGKGIVPATILHNLKGLRQMPTRMKYLIKPLAAIETLDQNSRILVIGPRSEWDFFLLADEGFTNLQGLDLISYSNRIALGDMHQTKFEDNSFDAILLGWTLSYSSTPHDVANELLRICKSGGIIGVAVEYADDSENADQKWQEKFGYTLIERDKLKARVNSTAAILGLFEGKIGHVYFNHDAPLSLAHDPNADTLSPKVSAVSVLFATSQ